MIDPGVVLVVAGVVGMTHHVLNRDSVEAMYIDTEIDRIKDRILRSEE